MKTEVKLGVFASDQESSWQNGTLQSAEGNAPIHSFTIQTFVTVPVEIDREGEESVAMFVKRALHKGDADYLLLVGLTEEAGDGAVSQAQPAPASASSWFAVTGRKLGQDEASGEVFEAVDVEAAIQAFKASLLGPGLFGDLCRLEDAGGDAEDAGHLDLVVYIDHVFESAAPLQRVRTMNL
jgi:hypothetical protein